MRLVNSLTHAAHAASVRGYTPGLATSLVAGVPASLAVLRALRRDGLMTTPGLAASVLGGAVLLVPTALLTRRAARGLAALADRRLSETRPTDRRSSRPRRPTRAPDPSPRRLCAPR